MQSPGGKPGAQPLTQHQAADAGPLRSPPPAGSLGSPSAAVGQRGAEPSAAVTSRSSTPYLALPEAEGPTDSFHPPQSAPGCSQHCWSAHPHLHSHPKPFIQLLLCSLLAPISLLWGSDALTTHAAPGPAMVR